MFYRICQYCGNRHQPQYEQCYSCSVIMGFAKEKPLPNGCAKHFTNPIPAVCDACKKLKEKFYSKK